jgi:hypothetical protein
MYKQQYGYIGRGAAGVYAATPPEKCKYSTQKVTIESSTSIPDSRLYPYYGELLENGYVIDKARISTTREFIHAVVSGPMVKLALSDNTISDYYVISEAFKAPDRSVFVSLNLYVNFWRELGARIAKRIGNQIVWEDGEVEEIPSFENRFEPR